MAAIKDHFRYCGTPNRIARITMANPKHAVQRRATLAETARGVMRVSAFER
jgi:hypothetical protein